MFPQQSKVRIHQLLAGSTRPSPHW
jgi:hypothetical protein